MVYFQLVIDFFPRLSKQLTASQLKSYIHKEQPTIEHSLSNKIKKRLSIVNYEMLQCKCKSIPNRRMHAIAILVHEVSVKLRLIKSCFQIFQYLSLKPTWQVNIQQ